MSGTAAGGSEAAARATDVAAADPAARLRRGSPAWRRASAAIFCAGLGTFSLLYAPQALLPSLARDLAVAPAAATLVFSTALAALGAALVVGGWAGDTWGLRRVMVVSLGLASLLMAVAAAAPNLGGLLALRVLQGAALAGVPPVALAYLASEIDHRSLGLSVGLYVAGNAIGGMAGRFLAGALDDAGGWRLALAGLAALGAVCWGLLALLLPAPRAAPAPPQPVRRLAGGLAAAARDPVVARLAASGALLGSTFGAIFSAATFRLAHAPFDLDGGEIGAVFLLYLLGSVASAAAGRLSDALPRHAVLLAAVAGMAAGVGATLADRLWLIVLGLAAVTAGFFAAHAVASGWAGRRGGDALASASHATSLYLLSFYGGSALGSFAAGIALATSGWSAVAALASAQLLGVAAAVAGARRA